MFCEDSLITEAASVPRGHYRIYDKKMIVLFKNEKNSLIPKHSWLKDFRWGKGGG
jgi:hypothetical protein